MVKRLVLAVFVGLIVGPLSTSGSEPRSIAKTVYHFDDPVKWATPEAIVPPEYPPSLLAKGVTATVDVVIALKPTGRLDSVVRITSEPKAEAFEQAVLDVLKHWIFAQSYDADCRAIAAQSAIKVWFELKEGQPSISVSHVPSTPSAGTARISALNTDEVMAMFEDNSARRANFGFGIGDVYTKLKVDRLSGITQAVEIVDIVAHPNAFKKRTAGSSSVPTSKSPAEATGNATQERLMKLRFEPASAEGEGPMIVCRTVQYR